MPSRCATATPLLRPALRLRPPQTLLELGRDPDAARRRARHHRACCTPGRATCASIPTSTASSPAAASRSTARAGSRRAPTFLFPVAVLGALFRGKFLAGLARARERGELASTARAPTSPTPRLRRAHATSSIASDWVVYAKPPFGGPEQVFRYLGRYTHRVGHLQPAPRLTRRPRRHLPHQGRHAPSPLAADEFLRRFLLHVLPRGFVKIRHFGLLAPANVNTKLAVARRLLAPTPDPAPRSPLPPPSPPSSRSPPRPASRHRSPLGGIFSSSSPASTSDAAALPAKATSSAFRCRWACHSRPYPPPLSSTPHERHGPITRSP